MAPVVGRDATIISIAAGIRTSAIDAALGGKGRIIRVMPNTPLMVGAGVSALAAGPRAGASEMAFCQSLFAASGRTVVVREEQMDAVTAVSGSGPAYFFYLIEAMVAAVVREGLDDATALSLAVGTCQGAGALLAATAQRPEALRAQVTSPNGTTQRAIETMDAAGVKDALIRAIRAAAQRSRELGR
jgi:pyrroline-5-carboxylate reductase